MYRSLCVPASMPLMLRQTCALSVVSIHTPLGVTPCMDHALSLLPCLVLSAHCNKEKAETVAQELLVETEGCSLVSFGFVYGPV